MGSSVLLSSLVLPVLIAAPPSDLSRLQAFEAATRNPDPAGALALARQGLPKARPAGYEGSSPLFCAALRGWEDVVRLLLDQGHLPDGWGEGDRPLLMALGQESTGLVRLLLERGAKPHRLPTDFRSPLGAAAKTGKLELVELLLAKSADATDADSDGLTPLHQALEAKSPGPVFQRLLKAGANPDVRWKELPLAFFAVRGGHPPELTFLLNRMTPEARKAFLAQQVDDIWTPLRMASRNGPTEVVKVLLAAGADPDAADARGLTALYHATRRNKPEVVAELLKAKANPEKPDPDGIKPLYWAVAQDLREVTTLLLEAGADRKTTNAQGMPLLHTAARLGRPRMVTLLLERGDAVDARDPLGATAFFRAAEQAKVDCAKVLLTKGADPKATLPEGTTALQALAEAGNQHIRDGAEPCDPEAMLALLVSKGLDVQGRTPGGQTLLHLAAQHHKPPFLEALRKAGCPVDAVDTRGRTALHALGEDRFVDTAVVAWFLEAGLDPFQKDKEGWCPLLRLSRRARDLDTSVWLRLVTAPGALQVRDPGGATLMHTLKTGALPDHLADLVARGLPVDTPDGAGRTRLMQAASSLEVKEVEWLLGLGADPRRKDASGRTALDHLREAPEKSEAKKSVLDSPTARQDIQKLLEHPDAAYPIEPKKLGAEATDEVPPPPPPPPAPKGKRGGTKVKGR